MTENPNLGASKEVRWKGFRERYRQYQKDALKMLDGVKFEDLKLMEVLTRWAPVNMKDVDGNEEWIGPVYERYYANMQ